MTVKQFEPEVTEDAQAIKVRLAVVQEEERITVERDDEPQVMTFPHLVVREVITLLGVSLVLVVLSLLFDAPLEEIANPEKTPNPSKAPWYFLGLQELLHYYPPVVAGVILPGLVILALIVIPYFEINLRREAMWQEKNPGRLLTVALVTLAVSACFYFFAAHPVWPIIVPTWLVGFLIAIPGIFGTGGPARHWLATRSLPFFIFLWFLLITVVLTTIGVLFRGPGWSFTLPWRDGIF